MVAEVLGESLDEDEAADMIAFANELAGVSGNAIDFSAYMHLAKHIIG